jgi:hypothetical protein
MVEREWRGFKADWVIEKQATNNYSKQKRDPRMTDMINQGRDEVWGLGEFEVVQPFEQIGFKGEGL